MSESGVINHFTLSRFQRLVKGSIKKKERGSEERKKEEEVRRETRGQIRFLFKKSITPLYGVAISERIRNKLGENHAIADIWRQSEIIIDLIKNSIKNLIKIFYEETLGFHTRRRTPIKFLFRYEYRQLHFSL